MDGIKEHLRDPDSAKFRSLSIHHYGDPKAPSYFLCGEVNSKNGFGGYSGYTSFSILVFYIEEQKRGLVIPDSDTIYDGDPAEIDLIGKNCSTGF